MLDEKLGTIRASHSKIQKLKKQIMKSVPVGGVPIRFPQDLDPFPAQLALMSKVMASLKRSQNALLGSPTGTGKTLVRYVTTIGIAIER